METLNTKNDQEDMSFAVLTECFNYTSISKDCQNYSPKHKKGVKNGPLKGNNSKLKLVIIQ